jgi:hypothetical protein
MFDKAISESSMSRSNHNVKFKWSTRPCLATPKPTVDCEDNPSTPEEIIEAITERVEYLRSEDWDVRFIELDPFFVEHFNFYVKGNKENKLLSDKIYLIAPDMSVDSLLYQIDEVISTYELSKKSIKILNKEQFKNLFNAN